MHLDAYPGMTLPTTLEELSPTRPFKGSFSEIVRSFTGGFPFRHRPETTARPFGSTRRRSGSQKNVLVVPSQSIATEANHSYVG